MNVFILAAGEGKRLMPFTAELPKPSLPFLTVPLGWFAAHQVKDLRVKNLVVNTFYKPDCIKKTFSSLDIPCEHLIYSDEQEELLGSGGGIRFAQRHLEGHGSFLVLNADELIIPDEMDYMLNFVNAFPAKGNPMGLLLTMDHPDAGGKFGAVWVDDNQRVWGFGRDKNLVLRFLKDRQLQADGELRPLHFLGSEILSDRIFRYLQNKKVSNILYDGLTEAIGEGEAVYAYNIKCQWYELGNPQDYFFATQDCLKKLISGAYPALRFALEALSPGIKFERHQNVDIAFARPYQLVGDKSILKGFAVFGNAQDFVQHEFPRSYWGQDGERPELSVPQGNSELIFSFAPRRRSLERVVALGGKTRVLTDANHVESLLEVLGGQIIF